MLLSFSIDEMRPMIVNGLKELAGEPVEGRVKRQTIRRFGPQYMKKFGTAKHLEGLQLDLWWKSRTPDRFKFGQVTGSATRLIIRRVPIGVQLEPIDKDNPYEIHTEDTFMDFVRADGFSSAAEFIDYFVPNEGDVFEGVLFRW